MARLRRLAVAAGALALVLLGVVLGVFLRPDPIDNRCISALLLVDPDQRTNISDDELQEKCPGAERFHVPTPP